MNDPVLNLFVNDANENGRPLIKAILLVSGAIVVGYISPNASVSRDMLIGVEASEDTSRQFGQLTEPADSELISLTEVTIYMGRFEWKAPFLRIAANRVDAWLTGGYLSGPEYISPDEPWPPK